MSEPVLHVSEGAPRADGAAGVGMRGERVSWTLVWVGLIGIAAGAAAGLSFLPGMGRAGCFVPALAFVICLLAAWYDAAVARIPNGLTYPTILLGLGLNALVGLGNIQGPMAWLGAPGFGPSLYGFAVFAAAGVGALLLAGMGGGDVKLMAGLGALLGLHDMVGVVLWALLLAVPYAVINVVVWGRLNSVCQMLSLQLLSLVYLREPIPVVSTGKGTVPWAVPLVCGLVLARVWPVKGWLLR